MAAAVEELAVLGPVTSWRWRRSLVASWEHGGRGVTAWHEQRTRWWSGCGWAAWRRGCILDAPWSGPATREEEAARDLRQTRSCTAACQNGLMKSLWSWHSAERFSRAGRRGRALRWSIYEIKNVDRSNPVWLWFVGSNQLEIYHFINIFRPKSPSFISFSLKTLSKLVKTWIFS